ncbi:ABC1 family protein C10F6.14c [Durusdinium trenchii]|uniref:ABC1 family protein C10F6.14c n=1 Tax=Durusdinium trenchii TaxID=1381693 RepID=A0ABP0RPG4_9DINO
MFVDRTKFDSRARYVDELSKLQDAMPADSLEEVEKSLGVRGVITLSSILGLFLAVPPLHRLLSSLMPHMFSDLGATIQDTAAMSKAELDFRVEAKNQCMARAKIDEAGLDIIIPAVIPEYVTKRVLAMEYVKGVKITDYAASESSSQQRKEVMAKLIDFYGFTLHGPIFNCDPHPGNILVEKETGRLCVLDWGQVRQLSQPERFAYAKIFMAALMEDVHLFVEGCRALNFSFGDLDGRPDATPIAMIGALRFLLRDSRPIAQSRADFEQLEQVFGKLDGETKAIQRGGEQIVKGPLMPLTKTVSLLFEVSSRLEVSLPLMHLFVCHGYPMLLKELGHSNVKVQPSMTSFTLKLPIAPQILGSGDPAFVSKLSGLLRALHADGHLLGAQLCVLDLATGDVLADLALGHCSWLNPLPVTCNTVFNILEISKMFLTFSVLGLVDEGRVSLRAVLQESSMGKVLLEHALSHTSGHLKLAPGSSDLSFREFCDSEVLAEKMLAEEPLLGPGLGKSCFTDLAKARYILLAFLRSGSSLHSFALIKQDLGKRMEEFEHFVDATNRGRSKNATKGQKAEHGMWMSFFGREHWFNPAALNRDLPRTSVLPGRQGFATAKDTAKALRAAAAGQALSQRMWREASRSRKPEKGPDSEPCRLPHHLERFQDAEPGFPSCLIGSTPHMKRGPRGATNSAKHEKSFPGRQ